MSVTHRPLRYGNFRELQRTVDEGDIVPPSAKCKGYYSIATDLYESARKAKLDGDLEKAFIYFVRFGKLALQLKLAPDFSKMSYPKLEKAADAISEAEVLQSELMKLYEVKLSKTLAASDCTLSSIINQNPQDQQRRPTQVFEMLENHNCLVIDLRDQAEFEDSHIKYKYVFNLPGKFIKPALNGTELEEATKNLQSHPMFLQRNAFEYIVILDYDTQNPFHAGVPDNHPIRLLYSILTSDDSKSKKLKNLPVIVKGGYRLWLASYPQMTTNSHPRKMNESLPSSHFSSVNVNYPSLDTFRTPTPSAPPEVMNDSATDIRRLPERPSSNRTSKPHVPRLGSNSAPTSNLPRSRSLTELASGNEQPLAKPQVDRASKPSSLPGSTRSKHDLVFHQVDKTHGLRNLGCSCYINASLQCLSHTQNLAAYFLQGQYKNDIAADDSDLTQEQLALPELFDNVLYYLHYGGDEESLVNFWKSVFSIFPQFKRNSHECAHEFITNLLSTLHDVLNRAALKSKPGEIPEIDENNVEIALNKFFTARHDESRSIIGDIFEGLTCIQRQCQTCRNSSYKFDVTFSLGLPIPDRDELTLDDCLQEAFQTQVVDYKCTHCNSQQKATQSERIARLPKVLVITFLRFRHFQDSTRQKANNYIKFNNVITLDKYLDCKTQPKSKSYHLYAVVNHYGELDRGHYIAYCKSLSSNVWYKYDDQVITENSILADSDKKNTYIAFYTCDTS